MVVFLFMLTGINTSNAQYLLKAVSGDFKSECYKYYKKIDSKEMPWIGGVYKVKTNKNDLFLISNWYVLPYKNYKSDNSKYSYTTDLTKDTSILTDDNSKTSFTYDINNDNNYINITFDNILKAGDYNMNFDYNAKYYSARYSISEDGVKYSDINKSDIWKFDLKYIKIDFYIDAVKQVREKIKIKELSFENISKIILIKNFTNADIQLYSSYNCKWDFNTYVKPYNGFKINKDTKTIDANLDKNPEYDTFIKRDLDNDKVLDIKDNCVNIYNPLQQDTNWDGTWDLCADDDNDGIIWNKDNCVNVYNPDQKDINSNGVWDVCEFDKDKDWIFDSKDNCINIPNPDQKDDDGDSIWNSCDNCKYYNPLQLDKDNNGIWDVCDSKKETLIKNDKDKDWIIDSIDNCKNVANPKQLDSDKDWVWNMCDNCNSIQNPKQVDKDNNKVWDMCEDVDKDKVVWYLDNCPYISNTGQLDKDNNKVWDVCEDKDWDSILFVNDNCPYDYNPNQKDIDKDWIGDVCDKKDNRYIESNKWFFIALLVFITLVFSGWIFYMFKKMK